jgi:hypothetical protein
MKINKLIYLLLAGGLAITSCKKSFLNEVPPNAVTVQNSILTPSAMADAVNGMYNEMKYYFLFDRDVPVLGDLLADNIYVNVTNSGRYLLENNYQFTNTSGEAADIYNQSYAAIGQANRIIYEGKKLGVSSDVAQLMGEAYASRGLLYLDLVNWFGAPYTVNANAPGVAIVTQPAYITGVIYPARATVSAVYAQIISDLDSAYLLMPVTGTGLHATTSNFIAKYATKAIEARAYLYKGDYANALVAANLVIANGSYSLAQTPAAFGAFWASSTSTSAKLETIFELNQNASSSNGINGLDDIYSQAGYGDLQATDSLYNDYSATDVRKTLILNGKRGGQQAYIVNKFPNYTNTAKDETKIIRYAEVILTAAESYARTGDETNAKIQLNSLAQLRDPAFTGYTSTGAQLISDIINERRKELAFEGLRFFDLTRLNLQINRPVQPQGYASYPTVTISDYRRIQPIPQTARSANPSLTQNPGYALQ